jgi:hypothetical protein
MGTKNDHSTHVWESNPWANGSNHVLSCGGPPSKLVTRKEINGPGEDRTCDPMVANSLRIVAAVSSSSQIASVHAGLALLNKVSLARAYCC